MLLHLEYCKCNILAELADQGQHRMNSRVDDRQYLEVICVLDRAGEGSA